MAPDMLFATDEISEKEIKYLCIGQSSAYFCQSDRFVNIVEGGGMYGFDGIRHIVDRLYDAALGSKEGVEIFDFK